MTQIASPSEAPRTDGVLRGLGRRPKLIAGVIGAGTVLLLALVMGLSRSGGSATSAGPGATQWYTVDRSSFDLGVIASGELEARNQTEIKCMVEGATSIVEVIEEGKAVKQGDVLVKLADEEIREKIELEMLDVENLQAEKVSAEEDLAINRSEAISSLRAAEVKLRLARLDMEKWEKGDDVTRRDELRLALERAKQKLDRAKYDLDSAKRLEAENFISTNERKDAELVLQEAQNAKSTAELNIQVYEQYTYPKEKDKFTSDLEQAEAELERTQRKNKAMLVQAEGKLQSKEQTLKIRMDRLAKLRQQLENTVIRAPQDGLVVYASSVQGWRYRGDPIAQGRQVRFNETLIILPDTSKMIASLRVHEARMAAVKVGQPVTVTIDARPGSPVAGQISQIGVIAQEGGWLNPDLREYVVKVDLPEEASIDGQLKPAMRCSGQIMIGKVEDALRVPVQSVFTEGKQQTSYVRGGDDRPQARTIEIGRSSEAWVEILGGLEKGDQVLMRAPQAGEASEKP